MVKKNVWSDSIKTFFWLSATPLPVPTLYRSWQRAETTRWHLFQQPWAERVHHVRECSILYPQGRLCRVHVQRGFVAATWHQSLLQEVGLTFEGITLPEGYIYIVNYNFEIKHISLFITSEKLYLYFYNIYYI